MPAALASETRPTERHDDLDNYDIDGFSDDPFGPPSPDATITKKRKEPESGLGIDEEVSIQKRARVPNVKLDEDRLLGPKGIPKLRSRAGNLKIKGKGHEFSDAARLLSLYQLWLDDLFPKAKFLDALAMVEKAGHKKKVMVARNDFIQEGRPKEPVDDELLNEEDIRGLEPNPGNSSHKTAAAATTISRPRTPNQDSEVPNDDDIYGTTPRTSRPSLPIRNQVPDDDDLEALIAEAEGQDRQLTSKPADTEPDADDLDALIAEAEHQDRDGQVLTGKSDTACVPVDFDDDEAAMQEMEGLW